MAESQASSSENQSQQSKQNQAVARTGQSRGVARRDYSPGFLSPREFFSASPFALMRRMSEEMDRMFGEFAFGGRTGEGSAWVPAVEVSEREGNLVVHADLPGVKPEEVKLQITNDALVLEGERKWENQENRGGVHRTESRYGQFYRSVPLPEGINPDQVRAKFENGMLEVKMPLPPQQSGARQIQIETGSGASNATPQTSQPH